MERQPPSHTTPHALMKKLMLLSRASLRQVQTERWHMSSLTKNKQATLAQLPDKHLPGNLQVYTKEIYRQGGSGMPVNLKIHESLTGDNCYQATADDVL
jgi:hypothetical protein